MIQALIKKGRVLPEEVPAPVVSFGSVLIKVVNSCISAGTELSGVTGSGKSLIKRALEQPDKVKKALNMVKSEGIAKVYSKIQGKLEAGAPTGYSISGIVIAVGGGITDIKPGDPVAAAGAGIANHAEYVDVPRNLVMRIPDGLDFVAASTVTLGGIAMQGVRRASVALGELVVVFGAGILGQLAVQMLAACGARAIAVDIDERRLELAKKMGAEAAFNPQKEDAVKAVTHYTGSHGADVVLFFAATGNSKALSEAFAMCRKKGRLVMVGVWGKEFNRDDIYKKELDFLISTSYGPGRYDQNYEERGLDYPYAYVRWTENRNMEEYLRLLAEKKISVQPLIEASYPIMEVEKAFDSLQKSDRPLMVVLNYGEDLPGVYESLASQPRKVTIQNRADKKMDLKRVRVGIIGAGGFATGMHLPNLQKLSGKYEIRAICSRTGANAKAAAAKFGAAYSTTDYHEILADPDIDLVMICTRHNLHGKMVIKSLQAGKHTFVEKPLCTTKEELNAIKNFYGFSDSNSTLNIQPSTLPLLMVGFNRRFSKYAREVKKHVQNRINPLFIHYRMNAGYIPLDHWVHTEEGGGRIIGEACHIIDLLSFITESRVSTFGVAGLRPKSGSITGADNKSIILEYEDGSAATLEYFATGSKELPKEWLEVHFDGKTIIVDDYKSIKGYGVKVADISSRVPDKGQLEELEELYRCLHGENEGWPIALGSMIDTTEVALELA
jgi:predicted dehydrogenase/threonine dehydrogenase-like Zn-dependent dehydrogenase